MTEFLNEINEINSMDCAKQQIVKNSFKFKMHHLCWVIRLYFRRDLCCNMYENQFSSLNTGVKEEKID